MSEPPPPHAIVHLHFFHFFSPNHRFHFRYQDLLQSKALLQKDLIASEEQRLQVSKYFIDLQLKSSQDSEAAEAAKFEQGQRLLSCAAIFPRFFQ